LQEPVVKYLTASWKLVNYCKPFTVRTNAKLYECGIASTGLIRCYAGFIRYYPCLTVSFRPFLSYVTWK